MLYGVAGSRILGACFVTFQTDSNLFLFVLIEQAGHGFGQQYSSQVGRDGYSNTEPNLSLGYEGSREGSPVKPSPKAGVNKNISEVLRALQMAKANIQNGGAAAKEARSVAPIPSFRDIYRRLAVNS